MEINCSYIDVTKTSYTEDETTDTLVDSSQSGSQSTLLWSSKHSNTGSKQYGTVSDCTSMSADSQTSRQSAETHRSVSLLSICLVFVIPTNYGFYKILSTSPVKKHPCNCKCVCLKKICFVGGAFNRN